MNHKILNEDDDRVSCPYDPSHKFAKNKLIWHISKGCAAKQKVGHLFGSCRYNSIHIVQLSELLRHENMCK